MSLQIVQNQQLKPIGDKVPIDTQLSTTSENAISNKAVTEEINRINSDLSELSQRPFVAYNTAISVGSTATIPYNLSKYREIGLEFQGSNYNAPYWIIIPTTSDTIQVGNVVGINNLSSQCGITFGSVTINTSTNSVTNVRMSLLYYTGSNWALIDNKRTISRVWLRK